MQYLIPVYHMFRWMDLLTLLMMFLQTKTVMVHKWQESFPLLLQMQRIKLPHRAFTLLLSLITEDLQKHLLLCRHLIGQSITELILFV